MPGGFVRAWLVACQLPAYCLPIAQVLWMIYTRCFFMIKTADAKPDCDILPEWQCYPTTVGVGAPPYKMLIETVLAFLA